MKDDEKDERKPEEKKEETVQDVLKDIESYKGGSFQAGSKDLVEGEDKEYDPRKQYTSEQIACLKCGNDYVIVQDRFPLKEVELTCPHCSHKFKRQLSSNYWSFYRVGKRVGIKGFRTTAPSVVLIDGSSKKRIERLGAAIAREQKGKQEEVCIEGAILEVINNPKYKSLEVEKQADKAIEVLSKKAGLDLSKEDVLDIIKRVKEGLEKGQDKY